MSMRVSLNNGPNRARWQTRLSILFRIFLVLVPPSHEPPGWSDSRSATDSGGARSWWQPATGTTSRVARGRLCVSVAGGGVMRLSLPPFEVNFARYGPRTMAVSSAQPLPDIVLVVCMREILPSPLIFGLYSCFCFVLFSWAVSKQCTTVCVFCTWYEYACFPSATVQIMRGKYQSCFAMPRKLDR